MKRLSISLITVGLLIITASGRCEKRNLGIGETKPTKVMRTNVPGGLCAPPQSKAELSINNVRAMLLGGGDLWWDLVSNSGYHVPKTPLRDNTEPTSSIFAASLWLGGYDPSGSLKVAANLYRRSSANDWFAGPIDEATTSTCEENCTNWDLHFEVLGDSIRKHISDFKKAQGDPNLEYTIDDVPESIRFWPAAGNKHFNEKYGFELPSSRQGLASFYEPIESDNDIYEPELGEFPNLEDLKCGSNHFADQMIFWIYNDVGGPHTNSNGTAMGMEVQATAYAYTSDDELDDMTFYKYKLINRDQQQLDSAFVGLWVDPDLGCYSDDYVGCDSSRNLMFVYNSDAVDGHGSSCDCSGIPTYCDEVPVLGVELFRGPLAPRIIDEVSGKLRYPKRSEPFHDTIVSIGMSSFSYYPNGPTFDGPAGMGVPNVAPEYYNYMNGVWSDGSPIRPMGTGYNPGGSGKTNFAFHDPPSQLNGWSMCQEESATTPNNGYILSSGAMRMDPGAINEITYGIYWLADQPHPCPDLSELYAAQNRAHILFSGCFDPPINPAAPLLDIIELDKELILVINNEILNGTQNVEDYSAPLIFHPDPNHNERYEFEGYKIFQVADLDVTYQDLLNPDRVREIATIDIKNEVSEIYNWSSINDPTNPQTPIYIPTLMADGPNEGLKYSLRVDRDAFADQMNDSLVNHKEYYYLVLSYAHNNYAPFDAEKPLSTQKMAYKESNINLGDFQDNGRPYAGTPRPFNFTMINAEFGESVPLTRLDGIGTGYNFLRISPETERAILDNTFEGEIEYLKGSGPVDISIYNPLEIRDGNFEMKFFDANMMDTILGDSIRWIIYSDDNDTIVGKHPLEGPREQLVSEFGFAVNIGQVDDYDPNRAWDDQFIGLELTYEDSNSVKWFANAYDGFIANGSSQGQNSSYTFDFLKPNIPYKEIGDLDRWQGQYVFPFQLANVLISSKQVNPGWDNNNFGIVESLSSMVDLNNIDIVFTSDTNNWSRCVVVEASNGLSLAQGFESIENKDDFELRGSPSVGKKDIDGDGLADPDDDGKGMSWFPGYAIDVESGQRLNIFFAENSVYNQEMVDSIGATFDNDQLNATDMMFNPSSQLFVNELIDKNLPFATYIGGQHFVYVMRTPYDSCTHLRGVLEGGRSIRLARELAKVTWAMIPFLQPNTELSSYQEGLIPNDVKVSVRVTNPYEYAVGTNEHGGYNHYKFSFEGFGPSPLKKEERVEALADVRVGPNPFYGFSQYGLSSTENVVKITNLPLKSTITILSLDGVVIREFDRDEAPTFANGNNNSPVPNLHTSPDLHWDLTTESGVTVSAGTYLIHVTDEVSGAEKTLKWFGVTGDLK